MVQANDHEIELVIYDKEAHRHVLMFGEVKHNFGAIEDSCIDTMLKFLEVFYSEMNGFFDFFDLCGTGEFDFSYLLRD